MNRMKHEKASMLQEEAAALAAAKQLAQDQQAAASSVKAAYSNYWDLHSRLGPICSAWSKMEACIEGLPPYDVGDDAELQQPALNAVTQMREGVCSMLLCAPTHHDIVMYTIYDLRYFREKRKWPIVGLALDFRSIQTTLLVVQELSKVQLGHLQVVLQHHRLSFTTIRVHAIVLWDCIIAAGDGAEEWHCVPGFDDTAAQLVTCYGLSCPDAHTPARSIQALLPSSFLCFQLDVIATMTLCKAVKASLKGLRGWHEESSGLWEACAVRIFQQGINLLLDCDLLQEAASVNPS